MQKTPQITEFRTIESSNEFKFKEKGSEFIALAFHVSSNAIVDELLFSIKKEHYNATHHCFAYRLKNNEFKHSDDGEPNGTAGIRIFNAIKHFDLRDLLVVVIRYYGGTKLGVGPLGKAYYYAAEKCLSATKIINMKLFQLLEIEYDFEFTSLVHRLIQKVEAKIKEEDFSIKPKMMIAVQTDKIEPLIQQLIEQSSGSIKTEKINESIWERFI